MTIRFSAAARRLGIVSAVATVLLMAVYAVVLTIGLLSLRSPDEQIGDPMFTILEVLIIAMMPALVALMVAVHAWAAPRLQALSLMSVIFIGMLAGITSVVHFLVLALSRESAFAGQPWASLVLSFRWPSVVYALDILAWDVLFPLAMFFAAPVMVGSRLADGIRRLMIVAGVLALAGLGGVVAGDMGLRNVGIVGYVGVFLLVAVLLIRLFHRAVPAEA